MLILAMVLTKTTKHTTHPTPNPFVCATFPTVVKQVQQAETHEIITEAPESLDEPQPQLPDQTEAQETEAGQIIVIQPHSLQEESDLEVVRQVPGDEDEEGEGADIESQVDSSLKKKRKGLRQTK